LSQKQRFAFASSSARQHASSLELCPPFKLHDVESPENTSVWHDDSAASPTWNDEKAMHTTTQNTGRRIAPACDVKSLASANNFSAFDDTAI
jgi:hypothetical protein